MKLNIGYNIRTLRRAADMTQDELAEKLGVTFQTVSRWENGGSYPDIELLPVLADIFGVTTDHLLGNDVEVRREQLKDLTNRLDQAVKERRNDTVIELLREFRRDLRRYAEFSYELQYIWEALKEYRMDAPPEVLEEVRQLWDEFKIQIPDSNKQSYALLVLAWIEDDDHIRDFLRKHMVLFNWTIEDVLIQRYILRDEMEKRQYIQQVQLYTLLDKLLMHASNHHEANLAYLHALLDMEPLPEYPVSADGTLDIWVNIRMWLGMQIARRYVLWKKDIDRAFEYGNDAVSLLEKLMAIPDGETITLRSRTWILSEFTIEVSCGMHRWIGGRSQRGVKMNYSGGLYDRSDFIWPTTYLDVFRDHFATVRDDPRYAELENRIQALVVLSPETE